nr:MAG TPA: hypothetical protein [Caudoviricetes sp.]
MRFYYLLTSRFAVLSNYSLKEFYLATQIFF